MKEMASIGSIPQRIIHKANIVMQNKQNHSYRWKKLSGLPTYFAYRLNNNYRILLSDTGNVFVGNHDAYTRKIKNLKRRVR